MTTDLLLEELLRVAYALMLMAVPTLLTTLALFAAVLGGAWATWRLCRGRRWRGVPGTKRSVERATQCVDVAALLPRPHERPVARTVCPIT